MKNHSKDSDCTVDPETGCCTVCGVEHGEPCPECGMRAYHSKDCPVLAEEAENMALLLNNTWSILSKEEQTAIKVLVSRDREAELKDRLMQLHRYLIHKKNYGLGCEEAGELFPQVPLQKQEVLDIIEFFETFLYD